MQASANRPLEITAVIPAELSGKRLDQALAALLPEHSRARLKTWIEAGQVRVDKKRLRPRDKVTSGTCVEIQVTLEPQVQDLPEYLPLDVVFEDEQLIVINKPAGLVVHPGAGNPRHTLMNALLHYEPALRRLPRAGLVHRLDKDTSGLLLVARTPPAYTALNQQLQARRIQRQYLALISGVPTAGGKIEQPLGRDPGRRTRMAVTPNGRPATTHYRVVEKYRRHALLRVELETGRTHQIRVHMAWRGYPIIGDPVYGAGPVKGASPGIAGLISAFARQALHAHRIELQHPQNMKTMSWQVNVPDDMERLIEALGVDAEQAGDIRN